MDGEPRVRDLIAGPFDGAWAENKSLKPTRSLGRTFGHETQEAGPTQLTCADSETGLMWECRKRAGPKSAHCSLDMNPRGTFCVLRSLLEARSWMIHGKIYLSSWLSRSVAKHPFSETRPMKLEGRGNSFDGEKFTERQHGDISTSALWAVKVDSSSQPFV